MSLIQEKMLLANKQSFLSSLKQGGAVEVKKQKENKIRKKAFPKKGRVGLSREQRYF